MYLWEDVVKFDRTQIFGRDYKTLDSLIKAFVDGKNVFSSDLIEELYNKEELNK